MQIQEVSFLLKHEYHRFSFHEHPKNEVHFLKGNDISHKCEKYDHFKVWHIIWYINNFTGKLQGEIKANSNKSTKE